MVQSRSAAFLVAILSLAAFFIHEIRGDDAAGKLSRELSPWLECFQGTNRSFQISGKATPHIDSKPQSIAFTIQRNGDEDFDIWIEHSDYAVEIRRRADAIAFAVPKFKVVYLGFGATDAKDHLKPEGIVNRLIGPATSVAMIVPMVIQAEAQDLVAMLTGLLNLKSNEDGSWSMKDSTRFQMDASGARLHGTIEGVPVDVSLSAPKGILKPVDEWPGMEVRTLERLEIEKQLARGVRRAFEVLAPASKLKQPTQKGKMVPHGELRWIEGQRVVLLNGTPEQIGKAHGELLKQESLRCIDSVVYAFGTAQTIATGHWFRHDLEAAYTRLSPYIPDRHKAETQALAISLGVDEKLMQTVNVFPELFHCSGFAVFGKATKDGKLYHGRVLDYMTTIGLQDAATTFIVAPSGKIPFANVGYAGFVGSVSGMNLKKISLGEMGGKGEGKWDGAPMATLMRRGLEECSSLEDVKKLWQDSPRTCEYYYVFADGNNRSAVGVAATPEKIEFVEPGQGHTLLGDGIPDVVVLSAGSRLEELRKRIQHGYGTIDAEAGRSLMSRPVAMSSNLHNVLFVPEDGVFYVANASHDHPAAERPYVKLSLPDLIGSMTKQDVKTVGLSNGSIFTGKDSLNPTTDESADAQACLAGLVWSPETFQVQLQSPDEGKGDWLVRFPSPKPSGNSVNDKVAMEWYMARDRSKNPVFAPAAVIVHESGSGMTVGRLIAGALSRQGIHTFMIQLPYYGKRRDGARPAGETLVSALQQGIADVRRAHDVVASLPLIDTHRISLQGTSLGGFVTATTCGIDPIYHRVIIFLAGGDLHSVVMDGQNEASAIRKEFEKAGIDSAKIKMILDGIEPLRLAHRVDPSRTWLFTAKYDQVVPSRNSALFAKSAKLDESHCIEMLADHYSGVLFLPSVVKQMRDLMLESTSASEGSLDR